ncbi:uncharacterized protein [Medicago truncatula]|uniref:uncharacterized protein isoform X3 n=1 Tax=Medicago truncatula TaxID=3880 RepID=UPI0019684F5A|nr:uncharacterized protein LOC11445468 isoform X3 [Medicago truncatula]
MDFHTLSRKELQALSKMNKIPANITNVAMADALSALPHVEGLDEILNQREGGDIGTPAVQPRTARRTTTQRKPVKEAESTKVSTRVNRGGRGGVAEGEVEQENLDANVDAGTPAVVPTSRRRVPAVSTRRKKEVIVIEDEDDVVSEVQGKATDVAKTPAAAPSSRTRAGRSVRNKTEISDGTSVQKAYSTRRSVRLVGKSLSKMSLADTEDMESTKNDDVSEEMSVSQNEGGSIETENAGASSQTESNVVSQNTDEVEVSSLNKADCESQSHDSGSEVKSTDAEDVLQADPKEEGSENVNHVEVSREDSSLNLQDSFETCADSNEAGSEQLEPEKTSDSAEIENKECFVAEQDQAMELAASEEVSVEIADQTIASLTVAEPEDAFVDVPNQDVAGLSLEASEEAYKEIADLVIAPLNVVVPDDACGDDLDQDVADMSVVLPEESSEEITHHAIAPETAVVPNGTIETSSEEHQVEEVFEPEPKKVECVSSAILVEKDGTSGDSGAENEVCIQSFENEKESNGVEDVILQLSMLDVAAKKVEDQKDTSEKQEAEAQTEEHAAEDYTEFVVSEKIKGEPVCSAHSEIKEIECGTGNPTVMKENSKTINVKTASLRVLKKLVRKKLEEKTNMVNNDDVQMQGVEQKRTALQALPQNQLAE